MTTALPASRRAAATGIKVVKGDTTPKKARRRPLAIALPGQGNAANTYATTKRQIFSPSEVADTLGLGYGSQAHLMALEVFRPGRAVTVPVWLLPLPQPTSGAASAGDITPSGTPTKNGEYQVEVCGIPSDKYTVVDGDAVADIIAKMVTAVNAVLKMPVIASDGTTTFDFEFKWEGASGNNGYVKVIGPDDAEISYAITQPANGTGTPDITDAISQVGAQWITHVANPLDYTDDTELDELATFGEGQRDPELHQQAVVFTGTNESTLATVTAVTDARKTDRTNVIIPAPGSPTLPAVIAAAAVREVANMDDSDPAMAYDDLPLVGVQPGTDAQQWTSSQRQAAWLAGCSSLRLEDGVLVLSDVLTCWHPTGEDPPVFNYVNDVAKRGTVVNLLDLMVKENNIRGRPIVPDYQTMDNPNALKRKMVTKFLYGVIDAAAGAALIADPDDAKDKSYAVLDGANSNRWNIKLVAALTGNGKVISIDYATGNYYGG